MPEPAVTSTRLLDAKTASGLDAGHERLFSTYSSYVSERMETSDVWGPQFKKQRSAVQYVIHQLAPSPFKGTALYLGLAIDRSGGEVDRPPTHFDQTGFAVGPTGTTFLDFFKRRYAEDGSLTWADLPFCSQRYLVEVGRSVSLSSSAAQRAKAEKNVAELAVTDCRSLLPELRAALDFAAGLTTDTSARLQRLTALLTLLLIEHQAGGHYIRGLHSKLSWASGKTGLPTPAEWRLQRGFDPRSMAPLSVRRWKGGFETVGYALLDDSVLLAVTLRISPGEFSFHATALGDIPYGP